MALSIRNIATVLLCGGMAFNTSAAFFEINFSNLNTRTGAALTSDDIMAAMTDTEGVVRSIDVNNAHLPYTGSMITGIWFDSPDAENEGWIEISLNPSKYVVGTRINYYGSPCRDYVGSSKSTTVLLGVNSQTAEATLQTSSNKAVLVSLVPNGELVKTIRFSVPYDETCPYSTYNACLQYLRIYYTEVDPENRETVEEWRFDKDEVEGYLNAEFVEPAFTAVPEMAKEFIELSSSDDNVATIEDNKVKLMGEGTAQITATLGDNMIFRPNAAEPAGYTLIVKKEIATLVDEIGEQKEEDNKRVYDINGVEIKDMTGRGIYLVIDSEGKVKKIIK